jgi:hypothetical protein
MKHNSKRERLSKKERPSISLLEQFNKLAVCQLKREQVHCALLSWCLPQADEVAGES